MHSESGGTPHCIAVQYNSESDHLLCWHGELSAEIPKHTFREYVSGAIDANSIVTFEVTKLMEKPESIYPDSCIDCHRAITCSRK